MKTVYLVRHKKENLFVKEIGYRIELGDESSAQIYTSVYIAETKLKEWGSKAMLYKTWESMSLSDYEVVEVQLVQTGKIYGL